MLYSFDYLFLMFIIYSILGYISEIIYCSIEKGSLVINRGFLILPWLPIYGISVVLMYLILDKYHNDIFILFIMAAFICTIVEFFTSLIMEKIFKVRWWDYSNDKFNIDGRVCLKNSFLFGLGGIALFYIFNPIIFKIINLLSKETIHIITIFIAIVFVVDFLLSVRTLIQLKVSSLKFLEKDVSEEITQLRNESLKKNSFLLRRLLNAFPKIEGRNKEIFIEIKKKLNNLRNRINIQKNHKECK